MRSPVYHPPVAHDDSIPGPGPRPTSVAGAAAPRPHPDPADARTVEQLLYRYAEAIDDGDFAGVADLLADAELRDATGARIAAGRAEVLALYEATTRRHADGTPRTQHVITNVIVEVDPDHPDDPDRLAARARFTVLQQTADLALQPVIAGRYDDRFARLDGTWRFVGRIMQPVLLGDLSQHLTFDPSGLVGDGG